MGFISSKSEALMIENIVSFDTDMHLEFEEYLNNIQLLKSNPNLPRRLEEVKAAARKPHVSDASLSLILQRGHLRHRMRRVAANLKFACPRFCLAFWYRVTYGLECVIREFAPARAYASAQDCADRVFLTWALEDIDKLVASSLQFDLMCYANQRAKSLVEASPPQQ